MPDRTISILGYTVAALTAVYVVLVITTVCFAAWQTQAAAHITDSEAAVGTLEAAYYQAMNDINGINPSTLGYVTPHTVRYVAAIPSSSGLTFAGN